MLIGLVNVRGIVVRKTGQDIEVSTEQHFARFNKDGHLLFGFRIGWLAESIQQLVHLIDDISHPSGNGSCLFEENGLPHVVCDVHYLRKCV